MPITGPRTDTAAPTSSSRPGARRHAGRAAVAAAVLVTLSGCGVDQINEQYGSRGGFGGDSINGTSVLGQMFKNAGHRVRSVNRLYPRVQNADVIVWFSNSFEAPSPEAQAWLDDWLLNSDEGKTLIYVSRDYSAGELYWSTTKPLAPAGQKGEYAKRLRESRSWFSSHRSGAPVSADAYGWFSTDRRNSKRVVKQLAGPWAEGVDATKVTIEHRRYLTPDDSAEPLLADGQGRPLVSEIVYAPESWDWRGEDSRLVMVENGSFLLNATLVNKEHRKLAGRLVDHVGPADLEVAFLETGASPLILESDPSDSPPTGYRLLEVWPIGPVLAQVFGLGLVFLLASWPVFGRPRRLDAGSLTDFGRHVDALGRLLAATRDRAYAYAQLRAYFHAGEKD
ncbi:MAG: hypothetical protein AAGB00_08405 [Planctomycetota bacterium]